MDSVATDEEYLEAIEYMAWQSEMPWSQWLWNRERRRVGLPAFSLRDPPPVLAEP